MKLTPEQLEEFDREGYLFLPSVFTPEETALLREEATRVYTLDREEVWRESTGVPRTAFAAQTYSEPFRRLGLHPRLLEPVMQLLDGPVYLHQYKVNAKAAFDGEVWQWHQDYGTWAREYRPIYTPAEAGLDRFVDLKKNDFIGRDAVLKEKEGGPKLRLVTFTVDADEADVVGDEPIWLDGAVVGWVTSGGYAHFVDHSVALGYVPAELAASDGRFEIEILGDRRAATLQPEPLFDPKRERMLG